MQSDLEFAVIDLETTGFSPKLHDRIIEVGIVRVDAHSNVIREYGTLVNPNRDVGATHVHGIHAADVREAPLFKEVVGDIQDAIRGAVLVAHNASFDLRFLTHECSACHAALPSMDYLCTLRLARLMGPELPSRKLGVLCDYFDIPTGQAHSALDDARATALLLGKLLQCVDPLILPGSLASLGAESLSSTATTWPEVTPSGREYRRSEAAARTQQSGGRLSRLFASLPAQNSTQNAADEYLAVLERALEDRSVSDEEVSALRCVAESLDMDQVEVTEAHTLFLFDVIRAAWMDKTITEAEQRDIDLVASLLGIGESEYRKMTALVKQESTSVAPAISSLPSEFEGKAICFTGEFSSLHAGERVTRIMMETIAAEKGMIVKHGVTKSLDILVCADPDTMSSKGRKARQYGVRIIAEAAFFKILGLEDPGTPVIGRDRARCESREKGEGLNLFL